MVKHITPVAAVLFDFDHMLMDTYYNCRAAFESALAEMSGRGYPPPDDFNYDNRRKARTKVFLSKIYNDKAVVDEAYVLVKQACATSAIRAIHGAPETLRLLKEEHIPFAVVSNSENETLNMFFPMIFGDEFKDTLLIGDARKPDPAKLIEMMSLLGVTGKEQNVLYVGDRLDTDIRAAIAAGCHPVHFGGMDQGKLQQFRAETGYHGEISQAVTHADLRKLIESRLCPLPSRQPSLKRGALSWQF